MRICCRGVRRRVICVLDNLNHLVLRRFRLGWLCDAHDSYLTGEMVDSDR